MHLHWKKQRIINIERAQKRYEESEELKLNTNQCKDLKAAKKSEYAQNKSENNYKIYDRKNPLRDSTQKIYKKNKKEIKSKYKTLMKKIPKCR